MAELPLLESAISTTENCRYCLMCRHVCPVGLVTKQEPLTPHGWALTIASVGRGLLTWNEGTVQSLYACADCGMCRAHCITDQPLPDAIAAARVDVAEQGKAPASAYLVRDVLQADGNLYGAQLPTQEIGTGSVALFVGDDSAFANLALLPAALKLLRAIGVDPVLIGNGRNSGYVPSSLGFRDLAHELAQATLDELRASGAHTLLVLTPGDLFTLRTLYVDRLGIALPEEVEVVEVITLLANSLATGDLRFSQPESGQPALSAHAYLDPSHAPRSDRPHAAPRALLGALFGQPGRELFWSGERGQPSGATSLQYTQPHIARQLTHARLEDARAAGVTTLYTEAAEDAAILQREAAPFGITIRNLYEELAHHLAQDA